MYRTELAMQPALAAACQEITYAPSRQGVYAPERPRGSGFVRDRFNRLDDEHDLTGAAAYLSELMPGIQTQPLSNEGTTAVVLEDGTYIYKVFRGESGSYPFVEDEAAVQTVLAEEGIGPRLTTLVDAAPQHRNHSSANIIFGGYQPVFEGKTSIPRIAGTGELPVIIREKQDIGPLSEVDPAILPTEFDRLAAVALKHQVMYSDCELHHNRQTGQVTIVDVGGMQHFRPDISPDELEDGITMQQFHQANIMSDLLERFGRDPAKPLPFRELIHTLKDDGTEGLHPYLYTGPR